MSIEKNMALVRRAVGEIWNGLDLDLADEVFGAAYVNHGGGIPDAVTGPESIKFAVVLQHTAFPRLHIRERALVAEENLVELKWAAGREPLSFDRIRHHRRDAARGTTLIRCADERIVESWTTCDCPAWADMTVAAAGSQPPPAVYPLAG